MKREYDFSKARHGPLVPKDPTKSQVSIRLDNDVVEYLMSVVDEAGGGSLDDLIDELLRQRILSSGRKIAGIETRSPSNSAGQKLLIALKILDSPKYRGTRTGRSIGGVGRQSRGKQNGARTDVVRAPA